MKKQNLYHIRIQRWTTGHIEIMVWPVVFPTYQDAFDYMTTCFTFKGIANHKASACVERCR